LRCSGKIPLEKTCVIWAREKNTWLTSFHHWVGGEQLNGDSSSFSFIFVEGLGNDNKWIITFPPYKKKISTAIFLFFPKPFK
jgi:hypothetical protein